MDDFRAKFTKWYYRKGYRMVYKPCDYGDGVAELIFICPWWVRLLTSWFFSPCAYYREHLDELRQRIDDLENDICDDNDEEIEVEDEYESQKESNDHSV